MTDGDHDTPELTDWLSGTDAPAHEGVYMRRYPAGPYSCWNGRHWFGDAATAAAAAVARERSRHADVAWRGLSAPGARPCGSCRGHTVIDRGYDEATGADLISECPECGP